MAAKLLHSLADENPDLQKQIGCMTGIFQIFDRQHVLTGRRLSQRRLPPPPGDSHFSNGGISERESFNSYQYQRHAAETNLNKSLNEKHRVSTESSRASFSSSCSSSLSSLECNKTNQPEASSFDRIIFPETPSREPVLVQQSASANFGRQSLDLRDVVKDSMYREARGLSVKTTAKEETVSHAVKHKDSPRPLQLSKSVDGSYGVGNQGKHSVPADLKESLRVLAKLREAPWYYNETRERPRSSYEAKDGTWHTISKDAPRFSYDGRDMNHLSFESRDTIKSTPKLKELPRLSLDSRVISMQGSYTDSRSNYLSKELQSSVDSHENITVSQQSLGAQKRPPSVVAKLMGLEALPDSASTSYSQPSMIKTSPVEHGDPVSRTLKTNEMNRPVRIPKSPKGILKEPVSPRWKNPDLVMKPVSRLPIEPAPWKQLEGSRGSQKPALKPAKVPAKTPNSFPSVYSEIEKRLKDLEFKQSGKDLRALKQILEAMQAKGLIETRKEEQGSEFSTQRDHEPKCSSPSQKPRLQSQQNQKNNHLGASSVQGCDYLRTYESPIVIMKPAKLIEKSNISASSTTSLEGFSDLPKVTNGGSAGSKKGSVSNRSAKDQSPRNRHRDSPVNSYDKKSSVKNSKSTQSLARTQQLPKESGTSQVKSSGSVSPRLQQKKLEQERRSRPPTPPSDSSKARRLPNRQPTESSSPGGRQRLKSTKLPQSDDQMSQISTESRTSSHHGDDISVNSEGSVVFDSKTDTEVTSLERSSELYGGHSPSVKTASCLVSGTTQKNSALRFEEDGLQAELPVSAPAHPSPVSVLDTSVYRDDELSPVKQKPTLSKDDSAQDTNELQQSDDQWNPADNFLSNGVGSTLTSEMNRKKLQNIENLVKKLTRLNSTHNEANTDYIASLCENKNPDHRYISEIMLASGLLLRDLGSGLTTFQLHRSGHPINPELFFVLEQTKSSTLLVKEETRSTTLLAKEETAPAKISHAEKFHRKLIFDAVNEILVTKLASLGPSPEPWLESKKLAKKTLSAQKLLKELCSEIEQLQVVKKPECGGLEEEDGLKSILWDDVMHRSESWTDFGHEVSGCVLDVERLIFKDLVDEIVIGGAAGLRTKTGRRRQLFAK
ncbi:hypothetical protein Tsubulata_017510 [Turnera subulata]|uniref:DUF4378 domain-containing protein n=1 Tax=Turnera subulata TaxID=218843 RepID=A0A9Q0FJK5_9ROSI|nr:hypothetical protein Tsubulata_017510 [Turnera subulata]